jgi:hypothetical protein
MKLTARALIPLLPLIAGCRVEPAADGDSDGTGSEGAETQGTTAGTTGTTTDGTTTDGTTTDGTTTGMETTGTETTGGEEFCGLADGPDEPWFTIYERGMPLEPGGTIYLECGGQGLFMFELEPAIGGVIPEGDYIPFHVELDVEGGFNIGNGGHFASGDFNIFVGCCDYDYEYGCFYEPYTIILLPPDAIADKEAFHGQQGTLHVTMTGPGEPIEQIIDVELWAVADQSWEFCSYGGYGEVEPLPVGGAIPE